MSVHFTPNGMANESKSVQVKETKISSNELVQKLLEIIKKVAAEKKFDAAFNENPSDLFRPAFVVLDRNHIYKVSIAQEIQNQSFFECPLCHTKIENLGKFIIENTSNENNKQISITNETLHRISVHAASMQSSDLNFNISNIIKVLGFKE